MIEFNDNERESEAKQEAVKAAFEESIPTTWIEFSLPVYLEDECWKMIERWLKKKGVKDD